MAAANVSPVRPSGSLAPTGSGILVQVVPLGMALGLFFTISYVACVVLYLAFPDMASGHAVLVLFLPGFRLLDWQSFFLGLIESFGYGWYIALIFGPLYNFFAGRQR